MSSFACKAFDRSNVDAEHYGMRISISQLFLALFPLLILKDRHAANKQDEGTAWAVLAKS